MRKYLTLAALPAVMAASPALAAAAPAAGVTGQVDINGSVAARCMFTLPNATISLGEISLTSTGKLDTTKVDGKTATLNGWCNGAASTMTVTTTELTTTTAATTGFDNRVDYTGTATAGAASASDSSLTAGAGSASALGLYSGDVVVTLSASSSPTNGIMVAGIYTGNVKVTLTPAL
jgi:hypothetical protein